jgi:hypothetical protein
MSIFLNVPNVNYKNLIFTYKMKNKPLNVTLMLFNYRYINI